MTLKTKILRSLLTGVILIGWTVGCNEPTETKDVVSTVDEFDARVKNAQPGEVITLANGVWVDAELVFSAQGTADAPIILKAEEQGKVIFEGNSFLNIGGEYLEVSGLVFKNGFTPTSNVISFRTSKDNLANNCRVTQCVIDSYNNPERFDSDIWVAVYGKNNRFDHNTLVGKMNQGVTMAVRMNTEESRENNHVIEYNYFGPNPILGSNGGETLRIGTSHYSRTFSNTLVQNNLFDRCNGEHEIISNKSCGNVFKNNVFIECQGTLTMRHGANTLVENNYFLGNRKPNTGGIRVINERQTVRSNYCYGLTGHRFRGALVVMNGVPNSPINRYNQVIDSKIEGNILVDCDYIQLCAGADEERSAKPENTTMTSNIFMSQTNLTPFTVYDDISGITLANNIINSDAESPTKDGFEKVEYQVNKNEHGLLVPSKELTDKIGYKKIALPVSKDEVGASYYNKEFSDPAFSSGSMINVEPGTNTIIEALKTAKAGDVLMLKNGGEYLQTKDVVINKPITIKAGAGAKAKVLSQKASFFKIENKGMLELENLLIDGAESPDQPGNNVVSTSKYSMTHNYKLMVRNCEVVDLDVNHTFDFLKIYKNTFADSVLIENTTMTNVTGSVMSFDKEVEDLGIYNVENVVVTNSAFKDIQGAVANIYRGGTDESTFGPIVRISGNEFQNVGKGKRNKVAASIKFHGVQNAIVSDCNWVESAPLTLHLTNGEPITIIKDCEMKSTDKIVSNNQEFQTENITYSN